MDKKENAFRTMEELNKYLSVEVLYQLKIEMMATALDIQVYENEVSIIVKTTATISKMPTMINTCSKWKLYPMDESLMFVFIFYLDE